MILIIHTIAQIQTTLHHHRPQSVLNQAIIVWNKIIDILHMETIQKISLTQILCKSF